MAQAERPNTSLTLPLPTNALQKSFTRPAICSLPASWCRRLASRSSLIFSSFRPSEGRKASGMALTAALTFALKSAISFSSRSRCISKSCEVRMSLPPPSCCCSLLLSASQYAHSCCIFSHSSRNTSYWAWTDANAFSALSKSSCIF